jgi:hypothetical protein
MANENINKAAGDERSSRADLMPLIPSIYLMAQVSAFHRQSLRIRNGVPVPGGSSCDRNPLLLASLCLWRRDIAVSFVPALAPAASRIRSSMSSNSNCFGCTL